MEYRWHLLDLSIDLPPFHPVYTPETSEELDEK
jgi:hypothetical protein